MYEKILKIIDIIKFNLKIIRFKPKLEKKLDYFGAMLFALLRLQNYWSYNIE